MEAIIFMFLILAAGCLIICAPFILLGFFTYLIFKNLNKIFDEDEKDKKE